MTTPTPPLPRTSVYIDGFNLYYGALRGSRERWLNLEAFARQLLPRNDVHQIKYFTALVKPRPQDPTQPARQQAYLRAIKTLPIVEVHLGHFLVHPKRLPLAAPPNTVVEVLCPEEKGSDVNIAAHLLMDGFRGLYDAAVVISNDSDLATPINMVRTQLGKTIGVVNPQINGPSSHPSKTLQSVASFFWTLRRSYLSRNQFPASLTDATGTITKPASW